MTVFEEGTYMTVGDLLDELANFPRSAAVCGTPDGRMPLVALIPSFDEDDLVGVVLHLGGLDERVDLP